tara:strand:- start:386 stop:817 length:432 start_codon:yes stop_codon:yes gene_type:complete
MKKLICILVLGLLWGGVTSAALFGSKEIILFNECYDSPMHNNYKAYKNSTDNNFDEWSLEINLKKNILTRTVIWTDKFIATMQSRGTNLRKNEIETFPIISSNSRFVVAQAGAWEYTFDIKNKAIQIFHTKFKTTDKKKCNID